MVDDWFSAGELPYVSIETAEFLLHFEKGLRILDGGWVIFRTVPNYAGIC